MFDRIMFWGFGGLIVFLVIMAVIAVQYDTDRRNRLFQQCLADGHKEYQCEAALRSGRSGGTSTIIIPVIR